jgi:hypothetical protein
MSLKDSHGHVPNIGDDDGGQAFLLCEQAEFNAHESLLSTLSVILGRGDFKNSGKVFDEKTFWLIGLSGLERYEEMETIELSVKSQGFCKGGYFILRGNTSVMTFDCGSLGDDKHASHGHADALGITLSINGKQLLVDPGMPCYHEDVQMRNYFRGTSAHNTVVINGQNQSNIGDVFLWLQRAEARIEELSFTDEYDHVVGGHNGYGRYGVIHRRQIVFVKQSDRGEYWIVTDRFQGRGQHHIEQFWHFAPDIEVKLLSTGGAIIRTAAVVLMLVPLQPFPLEPRLYRGNKEPFQGWYSPSYGTMVMSPVLSYHGASGLPLELSVLLMTGKEKTEDLSWTRRLVIDALMMLKRKEVA